MASEWTERLGFYRGRVYYLAVRATPGLHDVRDFAAALYYSQENDPERKIQIARIDTAHVWEAVAMLRGNWRTYAERFEELDRE